jgi:hypothetical protein
MGGIGLARPIAGLARYGDGYVMVASDGRLFDFSHIPFHGSLAARPPRAPIVSIATTS